jgi:hypothetical protein
MQDSEEETPCSAHKGQQQKVKQHHEPGQEQGSVKGSSNGRLRDDRSSKGSAMSAEAALDKFGCTVQEAAELGSYQRVMLQGRVSPDEAVWQWCADGADINPEKLRKMWEFMVDAGGKCAAQEQESTYLNILTVLMEVCVLQGILLQEQRNSQQSHLQQPAPFIGCRCELAPAGL